MEEAFKKDIKISKETLKNRGKSREKSCDIENDIDFSLLNSKSRNEDGVLTLNSFRSISAKRSNTQRYINIDNETIEEKSSKRKSEKKEFQNEFVNRFKMVINKLERRIDNLEEDLL